MRPEQPTQPVEPIEQPMPPLPPVEQPMPPPPMPPPDAPGEPPINPPGTPYEEERRRIGELNNQAESEKKDSEKKSKKKRKSDRNQSTSSEKLAHDRTNEFTVRMLAGLAVQLAIRSKTPEKQRRSVRRAEVGYLRQLWGRYVGRALRI